MGEKPQTGALLSGSYSHCSLWRATSRGNLLGGPSK